MTSDQLISVNSGDPNGSRNRQFIAPHTCGGYIVKIRKYLKFATLKTT
jgi:hypothetical protein